jgi:hypothetical protein
VGRVQDGLRSVEQREIIVQATDSGLHDPGRRAVSAVGPIGPDCDGVEVLH